MEMCPDCTTLLQYELPHMDRPARFFCPVCPYLKLKKKQPLVKKQMDPVISTEDMDNASTAEVPCPACGYREAAYYQVQIRSADEPMTTFYKCKNKMCGNNWRED
ncbi:DNA-directed RNA polymerase III subunit RPC10 isoform X2 [Capsicum annuum]|uniref:DNA-directed RNA polymerase III subunit RPC10 isoform X2 n=1 Tax=Capsicum annuum TaxID=4072 RepID=UPI001FB0DD2D|nr:DNA-directed RNA polymerase III subunit RPC10 isoform X2 [Capsicum annuum]